MERATPQQMHTVAMADFIQKRYLQRVKEADDERVNALHWLRSQLPKVSQRDENGEFPADRMEREYLGMPLQTYINKNNIRVNGTFRHISFIDDLMSSPLADIRGFRSQYQEATELTRY